MELKGIEKKKQMLTEILEYIARYSWYNEQILERCIKTISGNLFRALPRSGKNPDVEDEPFEDPAWAHLQLIYDLTLRLVINTDVDKKVCLSSTNCICLKPKLYEIDHGKLENLRNCVE